LAPFASNTGFLKKPVLSLAGPSHKRKGNVTGVSWFNAELGSKRLGLLHELIPNVKVSLSS
jgi:hypothetical protein